MKGNGMGFFKDDTLQQQFNDNGFVIVRSFLEMKNVENILQFIKEKGVKTDVKSMYSNLEELDKAAAHEVESFLCDEYKVGLSKYFKNYKIAGSSFLFKGPSKDSASYLHQDWNIIDENQYQAAVIWVPLEPVNDENGCLVVVPGSHKWQPTIRSSNIDSIHLKYSQRLEPYIQSVPAQPGDAIIYGLNTFHGSKPNFSKSTRKSAVVSISDENAVPLHYFKDEASQKVFEVNGDNEFMYKMFFRLRNGEKVGLNEVEVLREVPNFEQYLMREQDFYAYLNDKPRLLGRIRNFLGV
jgi:ectoine hydroxylase-related dioxygenase (phytanoyl-CoA dioxygenase family)